MDEFDPRGSWESYVERAKLFFDANGIDESKKTAILLSSIGAEVYEELKHMAAPKKPSALTFAEIDTKMAERYEPKSTLILQRFRFHNRKQTEMEDVSLYTAQVLKIASKCGFLRIRQ